MPRSLFERRLREYRADLLRHDGQVRQNLAAAYQDAKSQMQRDVKTAAVQLAEMPADPMFDRRGRFTDRGQVQWRHDRLITLQRQIDDQLVTLASQADGLITAGQRTTARLGAQQALGLVEAQVPGLAASFNLLPVESFTNMVGATGQGMPLRELLNRHGLQAADAASRILTTAIATGEGPGAVARQLKRVFDTAQWQAETVARTEMLRAHRIASLQIYAANSDIIRGWVWIATMSRTSCLNCISRHGSEWPVSDRFFAAHPNCRCSPAPLLRGIDNPITSSGEAWFDQQSAKTKQSMMGPTAYSLFERGQLSLADFEGYTDHPVWGPTTYQRSLREISASGGRRRAA